MRRALHLVEVGGTDAAESVYRYPVDVYHSRERMLRETETLFRKLPVTLGLSSKIPNPGDYFTDDNTGVPILVTRGDDGKVRAFLNVCRHRGTRLAEGAGHAKAISCPYHGWTYALDGELRGIPDRRSFPGVDPADYGLAARPAAERHGMIWVRPLADPSGDHDLDVAAYLGRLDDEIAAYELAKHPLWETREVRCKANWKLIMDTFLEPYHFPILHKNTVAKLLLPNLCLFEPFGTHLREVFIRHTIKDQKDAPESEWTFLKHTSVVYVLFPNTALIWQLDHMEVWRVFPVGGRVDESVMYLDFLIPSPAETDKARGHWQRSIDVTIATVLAEDFPTAEGIQRGVASGALTHATIGRNEPAVAHFERTASEVVDR